MTSRRVLKVAEAIRETVSLAILTELRDPRVRDVTVTYVEVSGDLRHAKVHISVMGDERKESLVLHGLESSGGFLQRKVADRLDTRYIPHLRFVIDKGVKHSLAVAQILEQVLPPVAESDSDDSNSAESDDKSFVEDELENEDWEDDDSEEDDSKEDESDSDSRLQ